MCSLTLFVAESNHPGQFQLKISCGDDDSSGETWVDWLVAIFLCIILIGIVVGLCCLYRAKLKNIKSRGSVAGKTIPHNYNNVNDANESQSDSGEVPIDPIQIPIDYPSNSDANGGSPPLTFAESQLRYMDGMVEEETDCVIRVMKEIIQALDDNDGLDVYQVRFILNLSIKLTAAMMLASRS